MKTIYGTILNQHTEPIKNAIIEFYNNTMVLSDIASGNHPAPLYAIASNEKGEYSIGVSDSFKGYIVVPSQVIDNCKVEMGHALVDVPWNTDLHYNVVVKTQVFDVRDINLDGIIDIGEIAVWIRDIEEGKIRDYEKRLSQFESKFRMLVEIILPLILKK